MIKNLLFVAGLIMAIVSCGWIFLYAITHIDQTQMRIFVENIYAYFILIFGISICYYSCK